MGPQLIFINKSQAICGNPGDQLSWCGNLNPEVKSPICICVLSDSFLGWKPGLCGGNPNPAPQSPISDQPNTTQQTQSPAPKVPHKVPSS